MGKSFIINELFKTTDNKIKNENNLKSFNDPSVFPLHNFRQIPTKTEST